MKEIEILVPGKLHAATLARLEALFQVHQCRAGFVADLDEAVRRNIRGIATMAGIDRAGMDALPALEMIANFGVGYDAVDIASAVEKGLMVSHTPNVLNEEVADTAMGLLINTVRELPAAEAHLRAGKWVNNGPYPLTGATLQGRTMGIYGLGRIGKAIAKRALAFGLNIAYFGRTKQNVDFDYYSDLVSLARAVDTLMIVAPGTAETANSVNAEVMQALGADGVIINIGRGSVIDEPALIAALSDGTIRAAGLDVFADEPHVPDALLALPNAVLLPHVGSASLACRDAMGNLVVDNLVGWFEAKTPKTPVPEMG